MTFPLKLFLESTALYSLGPRIENVDFAQLLEFREVLKFELYVAAVSWREYLRYREKEIRDCVERIKQCRSELRKHDQRSDELETAEKKVSSYLSGVQQVFAMRARNLRITILPVPEIDVPDLIEMSLANDPPFEEANEKGFRDAVIMFTILKNIENRPADNALIVTNDKKLSDGLRSRADEFGTTLEIVPDLRSAVKHISARIDTLYRETLRKRADEARAMLLRYAKEISESVAKIRELNEIDLGQSPLA